MATKAATRRPARLQQPGLPVDAQGGAAIDPTKNAEDALKGAVTRLDDLRQADSRLVDEKITCVKEIVELRASHRIEVDNLRDAYEEKLRNAEAKRIDAIRAVDVNAVAVASQRSADQASVLATQVAQSAEALRALVATTATTVGQSQQQSATALSERITKLEQAQYEGVGKQRVADPMMAEVVAEMRTMRTATTMGAGKSEGVNATWVAIGAVLVVIIGALAIVVPLLVSNGRSNQYYPQPPSAIHQPAQVPAPPGTMLPAVPPTTAPSR